MKYICSIYIILLGIASAFAQSADQNYVKSTEPLFPGTDITGDEYDARVTIQYCDALGRVQQTVWRGISPGVYDVVSHVRYNDRGLPEEEWLPTPVNGDQGYYLPFSRVRENALNYYGDSRPFSQTIYEDNPLNRKIETIGPGSAWYVGKNNNHSQKTAYLTNTAEGELAVRKYIINRYLLHKGNYSEGKLFVTRSVDENGNKKYQFTDKNGRPILYRQMKDSIPHDTYYVYDPTGNLRYILSPEASQICSVQDKAYTDAVIGKYTYIYKYDDHKRRISFQPPGCDPVYYVYDRLGRMVLAQTGNQRQKKEWSYTKYDRKDRPCQTGIWTTTMSHSQLQAQFSDITVREDRETTQGGENTNLGYTNDSEPRQQLRPRSAIYYDTYAFIPPGHTFTPESGYDPCWEHANGLQTGNCTLIPRTGQKLYTTLYYDAKGRVVQTVTDNIKGGTDRESYAYNFSGDPVKKKTLHTVPGQPPVTEEYTYAYDHARRLTETKHSLNGKTPKTILTLQYDELGRIKRKDQENVSTGYTYNIRSWIKTITNPYYKQTNYYTTNPHRPQSVNYNGNISAADYTSAYIDDILYTPAYHTNKMTYTYDALDRLTASELTNPRERFDLYFENYSYDKNGNITFLQRGYRESMEDELDLSYNGNQLTSVIDAGNDMYLSSFPQVTMCEHINAFAYDKNGNRVKDEIRNIQNIRYDYQNHPDSILFTGGARIAYTYDDAGTKHKTVYYTPGKTVMIPGSQTGRVSSARTDSTEYCGRYIYQNGKLEKILLEEGYISYYPGVQSGNYCHYVRDHLGSNRAVFIAGSGLQQAADYYPSGLPTSEYDGLGLDNRLHLGMEFESMHGLHLYDNNARQRDPLLNLFTSIDPLCEKYPWISPYAVCANNPLKYADRDGEDIVIHYEDEKGKSRTWVFNGHNHSLAPKNQFVTDFLIAYSYNIMNGGGDNLKAAATAKDYIINLEQTDKNSNFGITFNGPRTEGTVFWNPEKGLQTSKGTLSPATILEHEMDHGVHWQTATEEHRRGQNTNDSYFKNKEEKRVITGSEYKSGVANGELRVIPGGGENKNSSYRGHVAACKNVPVIVISPISNKKRR